MKHSRFLPIIILGLASLLTGCVAVTSSRSTTVASRSSGHVLDRLYFGRGIPSGGEVSEAQWSTFLAEVVTPRFPSGFTVLRGEGQWRGATGAIARERSFVLEVYHPDTPATTSAVQEIAAEYKRRFEQEAVLRVREPVDMNF